MITQSKKRVNKKGKEGKMRKLAVSIMLVMIIFVFAGTAFAYWQCPPGIEIKDPATNPFRVDLR